MQIGQEVSYIDAEDKRHIARVMAISGAGPSNAKTLDLAYRNEGQDVTVEGVPHEQDRDTGGHFWLQKGERRPTDPEPDQASISTVEPAFPEVPEPAPPREERRRRGTE